MRVNKKKIIMFLMIFLMMLGISTISHGADRMYWYRKMIDGKNIAYWRDSGCQYNVTISSAVSLLRYPSGMWNPIVLTSTTTKSQSKLDFYQYYENSNTAAATATYKRKVNGVEQPFTYDGQKDDEDWLYCKIHINDTHIEGHALAKELKVPIILHEICHAYGGKDVYDTANKGSIMYGNYNTGWTARSLTSDMNNVLVQKYNY